MWPVQLRGAGDGHDRPGGGARNNVASSVAGASRGRDPDDRLDGRFQQVTHNLSAVCGSRRLTPSDGFRRPLFNANYLSWIYVTGD